MSDGGDDQPTSKPPSAAELRTMASERRRRERKATVGELEDGLRNLMRLTKTKISALETLIQSQDAVIDTLCVAIESLETAVRELNPGWAGITAPAAVLPDGTNPGAAVEAATPGGGYALEMPPTTAPSIFDAPIASDDPPSGGG
jgi:hypothetical protein